MKIYVGNVAKKVADQSHKQLILDNLEKYSSLVSLVLKYGWEKDAQSVLLKRVGDHDYISSDWIKAVKNLNDERGNKLLGNYLSKKDNFKYATYEFIKDFKGEDEFNRLLQIQWEKSLKKDGHTKYALAPIMIEEGHVEAFPVALQGIMDDDICSWHTDEILEAIMHKIPGVDSKKSYSDWYGENKNRIKYNKESGNFEVR